MRQPVYGSTRASNALCYRPALIVVAVEDFCAGSRAEDQLLLYVSSHGVVNYRPRAPQGLHFAAPNTRSDRLAATSLPACFVRRYSVDVSTPDGALHTLARDFAFRSDQANATSLANIGFIVAGTAGNLTLCNVRWPA